jgi:hypothetical protein
VYVSWTLVDGMLFATAVIATGFPMYCLIAEQLPGQVGWDWAVWRSGKGPSFGRHGSAQSLLDAMSAAQSAVTHIEGVAHAATESGTLFAFHKMPLRTYLANRHLLQRVQVTGDRLTLGEAVR